MPSMPAVFVRQLKTATEEEMNRMVDINVAAFTGAKSTDILVGGNRDAMQLDYRSLLIEGLLGGKVFVAGLTPNSISSVAIWFGPDEDIKQRSEAKFDDFQAALSTETQTWWRETFLPTYTNYTTRVLGEGAKLASWHLQQHATEPCTQRQGLAKALVQAVEVMAAQKAAAAGSNTCLTVTTANWENVEYFYEPLGFVRAGEPITIACTSPPGKFTLWCLKKTIVVQGM